MTFPLTKPLIKAQIKFLNFFEVIADNTISHKDNPVEIRQEEFSDLSNEETNAKVKDVIILYWVFLDFYGRTALLKEENSEANQQNLQIVGNSLFAMLNDLKTKHIASKVKTETIWNFITQQNAGRYLLFHLAYFADVHPDLEEREKWLDLLKESIPSGVGEHKENFISAAQALEFLLFEADPASLEMKTNANGERLTENQIINFELMLTNEEPLSVKKAKLEKLKKITFDSSIPKFVRFYIQNVLLAKTIKIIPYQQKDIIEFAELAKQLTLKNYFFNNMPKTYSSSIATFFNQLVYLVQNIQNYAITYTIVNDRKVVTKNTHTLRKMTSEAMVNGICFVGAMDKKTLKNINQELEGRFTNPYMLFLRDYILQQSVPFVSELSDYFWPGVLKIFSLNAKYQILPFVGAIDRLMECLWPHYSPIDIEVLLTHVVAFPLVEGSYKTRYQSLLSGYYFFNKLLLMIDEKYLKKTYPPEMHASMDECGKMEFGRFIENVETNRYDLTHLADCFNNDALQISKIILRVKLLQVVLHLPFDKVSEFSLADDARFLSFQNLIVQFMQAIKPSPVEIETVLELIAYEDNHFLEIKEFESEKKIEAIAKPKSKKPNKHSLERAQTSFFNLSQDDHTTITRDKLPGDLLEFADVFKDITGQDLILVGGAVYNIFTKAEAVANDWDGLGLNTTLAQFKNSETLKKYKNHKYEFIEGYYTSRFIAYLNHYGSAQLKKIKVDISFYQTHVPLHDMANFDLAMKNILSSRDLYDSVLFIRLTPGLKEYRVRGYHGAIHVVNKRLIKTLKNPKAVLEADFTRLMRIAKKRYQHPKDNLTQDIEWLLNQKYYFPKLFDDFIKKGCGLYLMARPHELPKISDKEHLYLYQNEADGSLFYEIAYLGDRYRHTVPIDKKLLEGEKFESTEKKLILCKNAALIQAVLKKTGERKHTLKMSEAQSQHNKRKLNTALQNTLFEMMDVSSAMEVMEKNRILDSTTGLTLEYLRPTLDIFIDYYNSDLDFRNTVKDEKKAAMTIEQEAYAKTVAFHYFIHIHYAFLKRYENSAFKDYLAERYQSRSFKNCPLLNISGIAYDSKYHPVARDMLDYIERIILDLPAPEGKIVNPSPHLLTMINAIGKTYDPAFELNLAAIPAASVRSACFSI